MPACLKTKKYSMAELFKAAEAVHGCKICNMRFWTTSNGFGRLSYEDSDGKMHWGNPDDDPVAMARSMTGLNVKSAVFHKYDFDNVLEIVYEEDKAEKLGTEAIMMEPAAFEDELMKLWNAQRELTDRIGGLLDVCGFSSEEYVDWLNDYCLGENGQIERLVDMYKEKYERSESK